MDLRDPRLGALFQAVPFEQPNDRQRQQENKWQVAGVKKPLPSFSRMVAMGICAATPVTIPEIMTTKTGLKRKINPTTITAMPISGQRYRFSHDNVLLVVSVVVSVVMP